MATRKKAKGKTKAKRKKTPITKAATCRKTKPVREKASEEGAGPASIAQESQADHEGRGQADASQRTDAARSGHTDA